jgi:hypothetical protein
MPHPSSQIFLHELHKLGTAADRLRCNLEAAIYKHSPGPENVAISPQP